MKCRQAREYISVIWPTLDMWFGAFLGASTMSFWLGDYYMTTMFAVLAVLLAFITRKEME